MKTKQWVGWTMAVAVAAIVLAALPVMLPAQDWFRTGTGLGVSKVRLALPDFAAENPATQPFQQVFNTVLWNDLAYSGVIDMVSKSFYPLPSTWPSQPSQFQGQRKQWTQAPVNAAMISFGNLTASGKNLSLSAWLMDLTNPNAPPVLSKIYSGPATQKGARLLAHELANDIVSALTGGEPGIALTHIVYSHQVGNVSELWVMDYDGANAHQITHLGTESITPRWSPDASEIAFTCFMPYRGVVSAQICLYSMAAKKVLYFRRFPGTNATPAWSPNGRKIAFMSSMKGSTEIWVADTNGNDPKELTFSPNSVNTSPVWNPRTGKEIVFVSDRSGAPELYMMNSDGSSVENIDLPKMSYVVDPAWSPNGQLLAFSWRRPDGNFDLYVMDIASHQLLQLTRNEGRNERPWWAPDGRHLVFQSDRTGTWQIWTMLADGSQSRQLTHAGKNFSPCWSPQ